MRRALLLVIGLCAACGLTLSGTGPLEVGGDAGDDAGADAIAQGEGGVVLDADLADAAADAVDESDAPGPCAAFDAGLASLALSRFKLAGNGAYNENGDGILTLTNSNNFERGAAWWPTPLSALRGYDLTFKIRVGPRDTAGDGITLAVVGASAAPDVGDDGDGLGLRNLGNGDGGTVSGYAVAVDMYKSSSDPTDLDTTTLKIIAMPQFSVVAKVGLHAALNDGNVYAVDVSWRAPHTIVVALHGPGGVLPLSANDPALAQPANAYIGFTAATGGGSNSHQEAAGLSVTMTCQ